MKDILFSVIWAAICAWLTVRFILLPLDGAYHVTGWGFFPTVVGWIHGLNITVRLFCLIVLSAIYFLTGIHKLFGNALLYLIGVAGFILLVYLIVSLGWLLISWLATTL